MFKLPLWTWPTFSYFRYVCRQFGLWDAEHRGERGVLRQFSCGMQNIEGVLKQYLCKLSPNRENIEWESFLFSHQWLYQFYIKQCIKTIAYCWAKST